MPFKIDYIDGEVLAWRIGGDVTTTESYTPTIYVSATDRDALDEVHPFIADDGRVTETDVQMRRTVWRNDAEPVLRVAVDGIDTVTSVAGDIRGWGAPGEYKLYNVDFAREHRFCLENGIQPAPSPEAEPVTLSLGLPPKPLNDADITPLEIDGEAVDGGEAAVLDAVADTVQKTDPDVLILSSGELIPVLFNRAEQFGYDDFQLGRRPGWQQLAGESTYESYGQVGYSPARYSVPGRALIDTSNSFFWGQTNLDGILDLVRRSRKPLQETAWASIGNVFTCMQICEALESDVLVPWNSWRHEQFKSMATLHDADRGGFIFAPEVGFHENVHELDFASLYPSIMVTRNVSPDTIRCACHADREDVPGLGYSICDEEGFLKRVLEPLITDRAEYKAEIAATDDEARVSELQGRSNALKWILVSCFGYQGFSNAKFGRIECHEAINAFAREILLDTKESLEAHGWEVIHGIVDSVWVRPIPEREQTPLDDVASAITAEIGIPLEYEAAYEWIAFVPRKDSDAGALNRYFARVKDAEEFKIRGIEIRQRSTTEFVEECQWEYLEVLDETRSPAAVCDRLQTHLLQVRSGNVPPEKLVTKRRVSKPLDEYSQSTRNVAALERAAATDFSVSPGESIRYVVVDDSKEGVGRVQLAHETLTEYDAEFYATLLIRAAESIIAPLDWDRTRIRQYLDDREDASITAYT